MKGLIAPARYLQGRGILEDDPFASLEGDRAFVLGGTTALEAAGEPISSGLTAAGIEIAAMVDGVDACTFERIDRLAERAETQRADLVVGVGGGVALDTAKAVAASIGSELATVPTVASTDAPCSAVAVVYDGTGAYDGYVRRDRNPELVVVDTAVIAQSPARFLAYGMGDAIATKFEAEAVARGTATTHADGTPTIAALAVARECYQTVRRHGRGALDAAERDAVTPALERVVEANTLLSGIGFESGGLAAAHAFGKGFSRAGVEAPHGTVIAVGTLAQLVLEGRPLGLLADLRSFLEGIDLAVEFDELGVDDGTIEAIAGYACADDTTMGNQPRIVAPEDAADALRAVAAL